MTWWRLLGAVALGGCIVAAAGWGFSRPEVESLSRPAVPPDAEASARGEAAFRGAGFGGLSLDALATNAVPWRLVAAALVLDERARDPAASLDKTTLGRVLARFGFLPGGESPLPLGMTFGDIAPVGGTKVRVANLGCAACHAGVTYAPDGAARPDQPMLGMPNTSIDLEAYTLSVFHALKRFADRPELLAAADALFPEMDWRERLSLRFLVLPLAKKRLAELGDATRPLPFPNGAPGSTNGVAALKFALGTALIEKGPGDAGVVSIPDLAFRTWRSDLLADGVYAVPGVSEGVATTAPPDADRLRALAAITTFFTVPSMGVHPDKAQGSLEDATAIMAFLGDYRPQRFPGAIDAARAGSGRALYATGCASCHGSYDGDLGAPQLQSFPNWNGDVGTDRLRADAFDATLVAAVENSVYRDTIAVRPHRGYAAPPLAGIWASAPYLHNGSVPTLAALLSPETRPRRFMTGGHALDFAQVGIRLDDDGAYPAGYRPFSAPAWIDVATPGRGADGHRFGEALTIEQKRDLIEYLKLL